MPRRPSAASPPCRPPAHGGQWITPRRAAATSTPGTLRAPAVRFKMARRASQDCPACAAALHGIQWRTSRRSALHCPAPNALLPSVQHGISRRSDNMFTPCKPRLHGAQTRIARRPFSSRPPPYHRPPAGQRTASQPHSASAGTHSSRAPGVPRPVSRHSSLITHATFKLNPSVKRLLSRAKHNTFTTSKQPPHSALVRHFRPVASKTQAPRRPQPTFRSPIHPAGPLPALPASHPHPAPSSSIPLRPSQS